MARVALSLGLLPQGGRCLSRASCPQSALVEFVEDFRSSRLSFDRLPLHLSSWSSPHLVHQVP